MNDMHPPSEGYRATSARPMLEEADGTPRLVGHFARFGTFNEIDSVSEGRFLERISPGAFKKTFAEQGSRIRMLLNHGKDPEVGDKPIGAPRSLTEDATGPAFDAELFPSVPPLVLDGLRAGQYGVSYRFRVIREDWDPSPKRSDVNPLGLPTRDIHEAQVYEFGPTPFPADAGADIAVRSLTDEMRAPNPTVTAAPSPDAEAEEPHVEVESREPDPVPPPVAAPAPRRFRSDEDWLAWITKES